MQNSRVMLKFSFLDRNTLFEQTWWHTKSNMLNSMVMFICPVLDQKHTFWVNMSWEMKIVYFLPWYVTFPQWHAGVKNSWFRDHLKGISLWKGRRQVNENSDENWHRGEGVQPKKKKKRCHSHKTSLCPFFVQLNFAPLWMRPW